MIPAPPSITVRAASLPAPLADLRSASSSGTVLAVFERSAYLDLDGRVVALASADLARGPLTITVRDFAPFHAISTASDVRLTGGELRVGPIAMDLRGAAVWDPSLQPPVDAANPGPAGAMVASRASAIDELLAGAPDESIAPLLRPLPAVASTPARAVLLEALARGLEAIADLLGGHANEEAVADIAAREIAGRGPGLTPSGDDLLIGIVHALRVWPRIAPPGSAASIRDLLVNAARPRTTRISGAYLEAARCGWAAEPWHALVRSVSEPPALTRAAVRRLLRIGETSGADALTGFCWAWRLGGHSR